MVIITQFIQISYWNKTQKNDAIHNCINHTNNYLIKNISIFITE